MASDAESILPVAMQYAAADPDTASRGIDVSLKGVWRSKPTECTYLVEADTKIVVVSFPNAATGHAPEQSTCIVQTGP